MTEERLTPGTDRWEACRQDVEVLLLGRVAPKSAGANAKYSLRKSTARHPILNQEIRIAALADGSRDSWSDDDTWDALVAVLDAVPNDPPVDGSDEAKLLFGAKVLLNRVPPPRDEALPLPGAIDGTTLEQMRGEDGVAATWPFERSISLRKAYLTKLLEVKAVGSLGNGESKIRQMSDLILRAILDHVQALDEPVVAAPESTSDGAELRPSSKQGASRQRSRRRLAIALCVAIALAVSALVFTRIGQSNAQTATVSHLADVENATPALTWRDDSFWVPVSAPLSTLPVIQSECFDSNSDTVARVQAWLLKYGVPQYVPTVVTFRNVSSSSDLVTLDQVVAHGKTTPPRVPGFVFTCPSQGGGPGQWEDLSLALTSGSTAVLKYPPQGDPDIFLNQLGKGDNLGLALTYSGGEDFTGTISIRVRQDRDVGTMTLPAGSGSKGQTVSWHGIPSPKRLEVLPGQTGHGTFSCILPGTTAPQDCSTSQIERTLVDLWGPGATP